ncbi:ATP-binding protein [Polyangium aurulentum]|uniref:ATP-binding protein n=1 Tax=Polyangium aurulentum TaxID=2567896 RepID=UPI0010ADA839
MERTTWKAYGFALMATVLGLFLRAPLWSVLGNAVPFITFFPAIALSSWYGGFGAGVLTTLSSALVCDWLFLEPRGAFGRTPVEMGGMLLFVLTGVFISWLTHERNRAFSRLFAVSERERRARVAEQASAQRMARLQQITAALSGAATRAEVTEVVLSRALPAIGATSGAIALLSPDGRTLTPLGSMDTEPLREPVAIDAPTPLAEAVRTKAPIVREGAEVALPLAVHGEILGAMRCRLASRRTLDDVELDFCRALGDACAQALDRSRLYEDAERLRHQAEAASRAKDEFLAMLGHELRNPLAPMVTALELMRLRGGGRLGRVEEVISRQVDHLTRMVDDLLDVARVARGMVTLSRRPGELWPVVSRAIEMASPLIEGRRHHLEVSVPRTGLAVSADPDRLAQVISNLLTNAAKYTPPGGHIEVAAEREGDALVIRVKDNGVGMAPDLLARVFDPFVQAAQGRDRRAGGLGLGLTLVKNLTAMHGGSVEAHSEGVGRGSEFVVRVPALSEPLVQDAEQSRTRPRVPSPPHTVLVVDDNEDAAKLLAEVIRNEGWRVAVAHDGVSALAMLDEVSPDVAVLDIGLPVMDGHDLARRIRERLGPRAPRLVAVTGYGQDNDREESRDAGFERHLVKPVRAEDIIDVIAGKPEPLRAAS